jgi:hypothetical protein
MKIKKIGVVLEESDLIELEAILLDGDEQAALLNLPLQSRWQSSAANALESAMCSPRCSAL